MSTGLTICAHTGDGTAAFQQLDTLEQMGVRPDAFVWVHAHSEGNTEMHARAAARGCWIEFDGVEPSTVTQQLEFVEAMHARGLLHRTLISMDAGWYHVGEPSGGEFRSYESLFTDFLPRLRARLGEQAQSQLLVSNPPNALALRVRALS